MYTLKFCYKDGPVYVFHDVDRIGYWENGSFSVFCDEDIMNHIFCLNHEYILFTPNSRVSLSNKNIGYIEISKN